MQNHFIAKASTTVHAPAAKVCSALTPPPIVQLYMFGTKFKPSRFLQCTHFSPLSGVPDRPENYHTITIELLGKGDRTEFTFTQDNNATEKARDHSQKSWELMLSGLKSVVEE